MRLRILFAKYADDLVPNALVVTDEYMEDEHGHIPDFYREECEKARQHSDDATLFAEAFVEVPDVMVDDLFRTLTMKARAFREASDG